MYLENVTTWRVSHSEEVFEPIPAMLKIVIHAPEGLASLFLSRKMTRCHVTLKVKKPSNGGMTALDLAPPVFPGRLLFLTFELAGAGTTHIVFQWKHRAVHESVRENNGRS